jgi:hypothetical protein
VNHRNDNGEPLEVIRMRVAHMRPISEHEQLRSMNLDQRLDWMRDHTRQRVGLNFVRIDGHLISGRDEDFDDMLARFLMVIARPERPAATKPDWQG